MTLTNKQKAVLILGKLLEKIQGKNKEEIKKEILNASRAAFELNISYFEFAKLHVEYFGEGNKRMELLSQLVRDTVEKMEDERSRKQYLEHVKKVEKEIQSGKVSTSRDLLRFAEESTRIHNEHVRIHHMMNGF